MGKEKRKALLVAEVGRADSAECAGDVHDAKQPEGADGVFLDFLVAQRNVDKCAGDFISNTEAEVCCPL